MCTDIQLVLINLFARLVVVVPRLKFQSNWFKLAPMIHLFSFVLFMSNHKRIPFYFTIFTNPFVPPHQAVVQLCTLFLSLCLCFCNCLCVCFCLSLSLSHSVIVIVGCLARSYNQYQVVCGDLCVNVKTSQNCCQQSELKWMKLNGFEMKFKINKLLFALYHHESWASHNCGGFLMKLSNYQ